MINFFDILFLVGGGFILIYFLINLFAPFILKNRKKVMQLAFIIPIGLILLSFIFYYFGNSSINQSTLLKYRTINSNLDSLNKQLNADTLVLNKIDTLVNQIKREQVNLRKIRNEQIELQKRVWTDPFNRRISDSILNQIEDRIREAEIKKNYSVERKIITSGNKIITYQGKIVVMDQTIYNDIYSIDRFELSPILKKINFTSNNQIGPLNYYIDSVKIHFRIIINSGKTMNNAIDSILYLTISPQKETYHRYNYFIDFNNQKKAFLDSLVFEATYSYNKTIDFPNVSLSDTIVCIDFLLRRQLISQYIISFKPK